MKINEREARKQIGVVVISLFVWLILNFSRIQDLYGEELDFLYLFFFDKGRCLIYVTVKILHYIFIFIVCKVFFTILSSRKNEDTIHGIIVGSIFFLTSLVILLIIWPGYWSWDDIHIVKNAGWYDLLPWQHFLSGLFHIICLETIPFPSGVLLIQILIAAVIVGFCASKIAASFSIGKGRVWIEGAILIISLLPPLIEYILSGFRMGIYSYLELYLITKLFLAYKEKTQWTKHEMIQVIALVIVIASWRTEAIYYVVLAPIYFLLLGREIIQRKDVMICTVIIVLSVVGIGKYNNYLIGNDKYSITASMVPVVELVRNADPIQDQKELELIDRVIDVDLSIKESVGADYLFWNTDFVRSFTKDEYAGYLKAYASLLIKCPGVALNSMSNIFLDTCGVRTKADGKITVVVASGSALGLFNENSDSGQLWASFTGLFKMPLNLEMRNKGILAIACVNIDNEPLPWFYLFWNLLIPILLCVGCLLFYLIMKKWVYVFLILFTLVRIPLLFVASPASYFMYYLSVYLMGYVWTVITVAEIIVARKKTIGVRKH